MPFYKLSDISQLEKFPGFKAQFIHSEKMTFAYWEIKAGSPLPVHSHSHEQVAYLLEGTFELTIAGESRILTVGDVAVIPANSIHSGKALTFCRIWDAFWPIREDYL